MIGALATASVVGAAAAAVAVVALHLLPTGYNSLREGVSAYGVGRYAPLYRFQVTAAGLGALALVLALGSAGSAPAPGLALLGVYGIARVAIARYPADLEPPLTPAGRRHVALAAAAFGAMGVAAPVLGLWVASGGRWNAAAATVAGWLGIGVAVASASTFAATASPRLRPLFGAIERVFYAASLGWLAIVGIAMTAGS